MSNLLGIPETRLPADPAAAALAEGKDPWAVAAAQRIQRPVIAGARECVALDRVAVSERILSQGGPGERRGRVHRGNGPRVLAFREGGSCRVGRQPGLGDAQEVAHQTLSL